MIISFKYLFKILIVIFGVMIVFGFLIIDMYGLFLFKV